MSKGSLLAKKTELEQKIKDDKYAYFFSDDPIFSQKLNVQNREIEKEKIAKNEKKLNFMNAYFSFHKANMKVINREEDMENSPPRSANKI